MYENRFCSSLEVNQFILANRGDLHHFHTYSDTLPGNTGFKPTSRDDELAPEKHAKHLNIAARVRKAYQDPYAFMPLCIADLLLGALPNIVKMVSAQGDNVPPDILDLLFFVAVLKFPRTLPI